MRVNKIQIQSYIRCNSFKFQASYSFSLYQPLTVNNLSKYLMAGFKPMSCCVKSNCSANCATTTAKALMVWIGTRIGEVEAKHSDHLTTTCLQIFPRFWNARIWHRVAEKWGQHHDEERSGCRLGRNHLLGVRLRIELRRVWVLKQLRCFRWLVRYLGTILQNLCRLMLH